MRKHGPPRTGKRFLALWVGVGLFLLVAASLAWKRSSAVLHASAVLHNVSPNSPVGPSSLVDLHAEIEVLRNQRDAAQLQAKQLIEQLSAVKKHLPHGTALQAGTVTNVTLLGAISQDRHLPWSPSESRDQHSSNPELAAVLRCVYLQTHA
jgi:hypothetical protein